MSTRAVGWLFSQEHELIKWCLVLKNYKNLFQPSVVSGQSV